MTRAIDVMEAAIQAALERRDDNILNHMRRADANRIARDHILKAWERTILGETAAQSLRRQRLHLTEQAINRIREQVTAHG